MTREDLFIRLMVAFPEMERRDARKCVNTIFNTIQEAVLAGEKVELRKFGTFYPRDYHRKKLYHPQTREHIDVGPRRRIAFRASGTGSIISL